MRKKSYVLIAVSLVLLTGCKGNEPQTEVPQAEVSQAESTQADEKAEIEMPAQTEAETENHTAILEELKNSWKLGEPSVKMQDVIQELQAKQIHYFGTYNVSGERVDVVLEDGSMLSFFEASDSEGNPLGYELVMKENEIDWNCFQEDYLNAYDVITDEYFAPNLSERAWTEEELWEYDQTRLAIARNQVFAKYGRKFEDSFLNSVFCTKSWYVPTYDGKDFDANQMKNLSSIETENLKTLVAFEEQMGYRHESDCSPACRLLSGSWKDMDQDGVEEQIIYTVEEEYKQGDWRDIIKVKLSVGDAECSQEGASLYPECYFVSKEDGQSFLIIGDSGDSADYTTNIFSYKDGALQEMGGVASDPTDIRFYPDKIEVKQETAHFQCQPVDFDFGIENGKIVEKPKDYYEYRGNEIMAKVSIPWYSQKGDLTTEGALAPGDVVRILGGDLKEWVELEKVSTGEKGWIKVTDLQCHLSDGTTLESNMAFDGIMLYG